jgi:phosphoribosylpyrophosphate synthetase
MQRFIIEQNPFLSKEIEAFYHFDYISKSGRRQINGTIESIICTLKNDIHPYAECILEKNVKLLSNILLNDLLIIYQITLLPHLTVCVVPRAKVKYRENQLLFKNTVQKVVNNIKGLIDGTDYIIRHIDTRTTHINKAGLGGKGDMPYPGITKNTCTISDKLRDKNILLIDDLYTKTVNIDEDAIQALLENGAKSVIFYSIGKTVYN